MTLFGFNLGSIVTAVLEFFGAERRHRKEIARAEERGSVLQQAANREAETGHVQMASRADDKIAPVPEGKGDPHDEA